MRGVLLINLGSPDAPTAAALKKYLRPFLMDKRVINIPALLRYLLVHLLIVPRRAHKSAAQYQKIWTKTGSPLIVYSQKLTSAVAYVLGKDFRVALGMRYGSPSLTGALESLEPTHLEELVILPLYPHYSSSATGSALEEVLSELRSSWDMPSVRVVADFWQRPEYEEALAVVMEESLKGTTFDHLLFSYHGLPEDHMRCAGDGKACFMPDCCAQVESWNRYCYRAQCFATTRSMAARLNLKGNFSTSFQSRLGRKPWIKPYTDHVLKELAERGVKRLAVVCPTFVADCLETLEEIGIRESKTWLSYGGESLHLIPSLNAHPAWVKALANIIRD